jgi:glycosyltransferase involved in cell wall biosynthesis
LTHLQPTPGARRRVLLISHDVLGRKMAGPGIRYYHLSRVLSRHVDLRLAVLPQEETALASLQAKMPDLSVITYRRRDWESIRPAAEWAEVVIVSPYAVAELFQLTELPAAIVMDGYDPLLIEWLTTLPKEELADYAGQWANRTAALFFQYLSGDFFICASERQRYWWLGQLETAGRINPHTYQQDPSLRGLVDVVPYGLPDEPAQQTRPMVKGVWPGIAADDIVLLWGGGLWPWLDPLTAVKAVAQLRATHPRLKLIFPGTVHPNPDVQAMPVHNEQVYAFARDNGLLDQTVFFGDWIPYEDWPNILLESDIAFSLHHDSIETQLAYRSRMLEYIWAGVPMIATIGDATSELASRYNLGHVVGYHDVDGVAQAISRILETPKAVFDEALAVARHDLSWEKAARPLIQFCRDPRRAADRLTAAPYGVPYYVHLLQRERREMERLRQVVAGYENGRVMRLLLTWERWRQRWLS